MRRALAAALAAAALLLVATAPVAGAQIPLLAPEDATDLAQDLADAQAEQGVCYGWQVYGSVESAGSSTGGPDVPLRADPAACPKGAVELRAEVVYECQTCDNGDQARITIVASVPDPPTPEDLERIGYEPGDLTGDKDDQALMDMAGALPLLVAERGAAAAVPFESPAAGQVPASDKPTNSAGSDTLRSTAPLLGFATLLILAGLGWFVYKLGQARTARPQRPRTRTS